MKKKAYLKNTELKNKDVFKVIELILRFTIFLTFLGHGIIALEKNMDWLIYIETVGFSTKTSEKLMTLIGVLDIVVASLMIIKPYKIIVLWAVIWTFSTALIRPISGESIWAFVERGTNWGSALILFLILQKKFKK
ncbi:hypothetical protein [Aquimarina sp. 2201CG5-10]|uniref:hypothetical protein n=1 Tax=Aquimarina callyspongiae TaxID=3098150 RepID=UPI002AB4F0E9|nr:hypothetical protein [Aquimarina sp. 2201CG5-10]MDY8134169.1 hypothetical protein [Aquimarina sp. 2201CG5-10]